jgi:prepilin-type N-terminal cleavage/methylation domain-containing protein
VPGRASSSGFSLAETLVALSVLAVASAAMLPAIALAGRLQRDSAVATEAAIIAAARLEGLKADVAAARVARGGSLDAAVDGWHVLLDRAGAPAAAGRAVYECRARVVASVSPGVAIAAVRVLVRGQAEGAITLSTAVHDD